MAVLGRHDVAFEECRDCGSLQTERPYWLDEAYGQALAATDVGAVQRCLTTQGAVWWVLKILGPDATPVRLLDFGGGAGLLCRLLRDLGIDAWMSDRHGKGDYARAYLLQDEPAAGRFDVITAFEVLEHLVDPAEELGRLFALQPQLLITSTELYGPGRGTDWNYYSAATGQHVFFYSRPALAQLAVSHGYELFSIAGFQVFSKRPIAGWQRRLLSLLLRAKPLALTRVWLATRPAGPHIGADHAATMRALEASRAKTP